MCKLSQKKATIKRGGLVLMLNTSQPYFYHDENNYQCNEDI